MENRRIVTVGIDGQVPEIRLEGAVFLRQDGARGTVLIGLKTRQENDAEQALQFASANISADRRMVVKEVSVEVDRKENISVDWELTFGAEIRALEDGEVLVAPDIARVYDRLFLFERVEEKGRERFYLRGERKRPTRLRGLRPDHALLVGRNSEIEKLKDLIDQASEDQGQVVGIVGEAGIGKTRLTVELKEILKERSIPSVEGVYSLQSSQPYSALQQIIVSLAGGTITTLTRWAMTDAECDYLRLFLEPNQKIERLSGLSEEQIRQGLFFAVRKLIHSAAQTPIALILEDLHWADKASLSLIEYVMENVESTHLLLVLIHRPELNPEWTKRLNYSEVRLSPLREKDIGEMLRQLLTVDRIAANVQEELSRLSVGNPFFLEELTRQWTATNVFVIETDEEGKRSLRLKEKTTADIPTTVHALISSRFDKLPSEQKEALKWASQLGTTFEADELEGILTQELRGDSKAILGPLFDKAYLTEKSVFPSRVYQFQHDLIFDQIRQSLSEQDRKRRHVVVGQFLRKLHSGQVDAHIERIAEHFLEGDENDLAIEFSLQAGVVASQGHRYPRAVYFHERVCRRWEEQPSSKFEPRRIYAPFVRALLTIGQLDPAGSALLRWEKNNITGSDRNDFEFNRLKAMHFQACSEFPKAIESTSNALALSKTANVTEEERIEIVILRVESLSRMGRIREALHESLLELRNLQESEHRTAQARLRLVAAICATNAGDLDGALDHLNRADDRTTDDLSPKVQLEILKRKGIVMDTVERFNEALQIVSRAKKLAHTASLRQDYVYFSALCGVEATEIGDYIRAEQEYELALQEAMSIRDRAMEERCLVGLADVFVDMGATNRALDYWQKSADKALGNDPWQTARQKLIRASIAEQQGAIDLALKLRLEAEEAQNKVGDNPFSRRSTLQRLRSEVLARNRPIQAVVAEFNQLVTQTKGAPGAGWNYLLHAFSYICAEKGGNPIPSPDRHFDPSTCPQAWLRQLVFIAKIRWLDSTGAKDDAKELRQIYRKERERIAQRVPAQYLEAFHNHPLYRVPE